MESVIAGETLMGEELVAVPESEAGRLGEAITEAVGNLYPGDVSDEEVKRYQAAIIMIVGDMSRLQSMPKQAFASAQSIARFGYLTRQVEVDRFGPFDYGQPGFPELLMEYLSETDDEHPVSAACVDWALQEPDHPKPDEPSLLWLIPGLGGQMRDQLSEHAVISLTPEEGLPNEISFGELKKCWRFGFFYRSATEVLTERSPSGQETRKTAERLGWRPPEGDDSNPSPVSEARHVDDPDLDAESEQSAHGREPLDIDQWIGETATACANQFESAAEVLLQLGALKMLDLDSFEGMKGDEPSAVVSNTRFGYALRSVECQHMSCGSNQAHGEDELFAKLNECANIFSVGTPSLWLPTILRDTIDLGHYGGIDQALECIPGTIAESRRKVVAVWADRYWPGDHPHTGREATRRLALFGYLLHRVCEICPEIILED